MDIPVAILPALMLIDGDLHSKAQFTLGDLDALLLAWRGLTAGTVVRRCFYDWVRLASSVDKP